MTLTLIRIGETVRCKSCPAVVYTRVDGEIRVRIKQQSVVIREAKSVSVVCENGHDNHFGVAPLAKMA